MADRVIDVANLPGSSTHTVVSGRGYFPVIAHLGGQELLVVLRGGAGHMGLGGRLDAVRSTDGGETWSAPVTVADSERDDRNPALGIARDGTIVIAYHWQGSYGEDGKWSPGGGPVDTRVIRSRDGGRTWEDDRPLGCTALNGASPFGKIRRDEDGVLYMPIYRGKDDGPWQGTVDCPPGGAATRLLLSRDNGQTWGEALDVARGLNEADLLMLSNEEWLFAGRSEAREEQAVYTCRSTDRGRTWSDLTRVTEAREHPPDLTALGSGGVLLTYGRRHPPFGVEGRYSPDGARSWSPHRLVLATDLPGTDIGYPSTTRLESGNLVTVFYRAGSKAEPNNGYEAIEASCVAVCYSEASLLAALGSE